MADFDFHSVVDFIKQAQGSELATKSYPRNFLGLRVKVGFGQGNPAKVPWIAVIGYNQSVSDGIYPVYLYYKKHNLLILAYGVSDTNASAKNWSLKQPSNTIDNFFRQNYLGKPARYGDSYVFKVYSIITNQSSYGLSEQTVIEDLNQIVEEFKEQFSTTPPKPLEPSYNPQPSPQPNPEPLPRVIMPIQKFSHDVRSAGLNIGDHVITRFIASLLTKPFVIFTGLSGSGKTKLAQAFASWICESEEQYRIIPVGADWTNREPLLGYPNALEPNKYVSPDCGSLDLILTAMKPENESKPYFLILDEMNMSHVERYFADFLSAMESGEPIRLHPGKDPYDNVPAEIVMPGNLFIVGTVNIDETTYMFSPKVLDRASVIEFRVTNEEMKQYLNSSGGLDMSTLKYAGASMAESFMSLTKQPSPTIEGSDAVLLEFFDELKKIGNEFGYRTAAEVIRFCNLVIELDKSWTQDQIFDAAIMQKLLPKVHGSRRKLEPVLKTLGKICLLPNEPKILEDLFSFKTDLDSVKAKLKYPISLEKVLRMYRGLIDNGFTSYAEA